MHKKCDILRTRDTHLQTFFSRVVYLIHPAQIAGGLISDGDVGLVYAEKRCLFFLYHKVPTTCTNGLFWKYKMYQISRFDKNKRQENMLCSYFRNHKYISTTL